MVNDSCYRGKDSEDFVSQGNFGNPISVLAQRLTVVGEQFFPFVSRFWCSAIICFLCEAVRGGAIGKKVNGT